MNIAQIKRVIKENSKELKSFVDIGEETYFATFLPKGRPGRDSFNKIRLALKKAGATVSRISQRRSKAFPGDLIMRFSVDDNFIIHYSFTVDDKITDLMVLDIIEPLEITRRRKKEYEDCLI